jgi:Cu(I)/Ag(I) efflux system membrane fusion protein
VKISLIGVGIVALAVMSFILGRATDQAADANHEAAPGSFDNQNPGLHRAQIARAAIHQSSNIPTETVHRQSPRQTIHTIGTVATDANNSYRLFAGTTGRLTSLGNNAPGTIVRKDEVLATFFSNEFVKAEQAYFFSLEARQRDKSASPDADVLRSGESVRSHEAILISMGMGETQLRQLAKTRQVTREIAITSPANGIVMSRSLFPSQVLEDEQEMYRIVALDTVWVFANVTPAEMTAIGPGTKARVIDRNTGKTLSSKLGTSLSLANSAQNILQLKLEVDNRSLLLHPDMLVDVELEIPATSQMTVPATAVVDTGFEQFVFVETADRTYQPKVIEIGRKLGDRVIVQRGLFDQEKVVASANFLIDSESRLLHH